MHLMIIYFGRGFETCSVSCSRRTTGTHERHREAWMVVSPGRDVSVRRIFRDEFDSHAIFMPAWILLQRRVTSSHLVHGGRSLRWWSDGRQDLSSWFFLPLAIRSSHKLP